ncbi:MAG: DNA translocase FtsK 4TM domain-containing protein [Lentisphaeria bacterium]|nr:DNA translocase FtsK 4TM domain-containing protein [Lentisphaeria bacterium]
MAKNDKKTTPENIGERNFKLRYLLAFVISILFMLAIISYSPDDFESGTLIKNYIGETGAAVAVVSFRAVGLASYVLVAFVLLWGVRHLLWQIPWERKFYWTGIVFAVLGTAILFAINPLPFVNVTDVLGLGHRGAPEQAIPGGMLGQFLAAPGADIVPPVSAGILRKYIGYVGTSIVGYLLLFGGILIVYLSDWHKVIVALVRKTGEEKVPSSPKNSAIREALLAMKERHEEKVEQRAEEKAKKEAEKAREAERRRLEDEAKRREASAAVPVQEELIAEEVETASVPVPQRVAASSINAPAATIHAAEPEVNIVEKGEKGHKPFFSSEYARPNLNMLSKGEEKKAEDISEIERKKSVLQATLDSFKVDGRVGNHITGPRVTRYEITLAPGVKVDKVSSLADNIKMNLEATSIRILAPIPGKNAVGVEAPNAESDAVFARTIMESPEWVNSDAEMPIILGKDVAGKPILLDLAKAPHLLIAGQTGSGKSVCMNTLIMSLLFRFSPDDLRLIMVDPKVVELKDYETIPHLITPVLNDSQKVPLALRWAVNEMERRYRLLADAGVKSMKAFNKRHIADGEVDRNGEPMPAKLPLLVIIIDELADLMLTEAKVEVETSINKIAAKARAAGMHIVVATQRPSTNIITGVIKANLPTRIAFKVGSGVDSRVILDRTGAEKLLGKGDMLFLPPGASELERVQGAFVPDPDIKKVVDFIAAQRAQEFNETILVDETEEEDGGDVRSGKRSDDSRSELDDVMDDILSEEYAPLVQKYSQPGDDKLTLQALEIILSSRQASTSYLQRRLGIGYNRAANLIDIFEQRGIIGPQSTGGNKRQILVFDEIDGV